MAQLRDLLVNGASRFLGVVNFNDNVNIDGKVTATEFSGDGSDLNNLNATNISSGTLATGRLPTSGATAGSYGPSENASPAHSGTFSVPYITIDSYGRVTGASTQTITLPADKNTDTKVTQSAAITTDKNYPLLLGYSDSTSSVTNTVKKSADLLFNPSTKFLTFNNGGGIITRRTTADTEMLKLFVESNNGAIVNVNETEESRLFFYMQYKDAPSDIVPIKFLGSASGTEIIAGKFTGGAALTGTPTAPTAAAGTNTTQIATTAFVDAAVKAGFAANDAMVYKGVIAGTSSSPGKYTPAAMVGETYRVSTAGYINGIKVEVGDILICVTDTVAATSSNYSTIKSNWNIIQSNIDGAVIGPASATSGGIAIFDGTSGKIIKDSGFKISSLTAARMCYTTANGELYSGYHYADNTHLGVGYTGSTAPDYTLYVGKQNSSAGTLGVETSITVGNNATAEYDSTRKALRFIVS